MEGDDDKEKKNGFCATGKDLNKYLKGGKFITFILAPFASILMKGWS